MVEKKIIKSKREIFVISLIFLLVLLMLPSVHSTLTTQVIAYYNFSETSGVNGFDVKNYANLNYSNTLILSATGKIGRSIYPNNAYYALSTKQMQNIPYIRSNVFTICFWSNWATTHQQADFIYEADSAGYKGMFIQSNNSGLYRFHVYDGISGANGIDFKLNSTLKTPCFGSWCFLCNEYKSGGVMTFWINGAIKANITAPTYGNTQTGRGFAIGGSYGSNYFNGYIDEFGYWNRTLTSAEIVSLYNSGTGITYPFIPPTPANFTIRIYDIYSGAPLMSFNASIKNETKLWNFTTTTGILNAYPFKINQGTPIINITIKTSNYLNRYVLFYNISASGNLNQSVIQAVLNIIPKQKISGSNVPAGYTFRINGGSTIYNNPLYLLAGTYNVTFNETGWYQQNQVYVVTALSNTTRNLTGCYNAKLNVSVKQGGTSTPINGATINLTWLNYTHSEQIIPTGASTIFNTIVNLTYRASAKKPGSWLQNNYTAKITKRTPLWNISLYQWNTFNITTINEETLALILNTTTNIYGITSRYNNTLSMDTGKGTLSLLVPDLYAFIYKDKLGKYTERFRYITMVNGTYNNIKLYLLNISKGSAISVTLLDQVGNKLSDYVVVAEKFIPASYEYIPVQSELTSVDGLSSFNLLTGNTQYRWKVVKDNSIVYMENLSKIFSTTKTIKVTLGSTFNTGQEALSTWQLATSLTNKSTLMNLSWISLQGTTGTICMNVSWQNTSSTPRININGQCSSASSGSLTYNYSAYTTGTITAVSWIKGSTNILDVYNVILGTGVKLWNIIGNDGWLVYMILMIVGACFMITNITAMPMVLAIIHFACWGMGLIPINVGVTGLAVIVVLILISLRLEK